MPSRFPILGGTVSIAGSGFGTGGAAPVGVEAVAVALAAGCRAPMSPQWICANLLALGGMGGGAGQWICAGDEGSLQVGSDSSWIAPNT